MCVYVCMHKQSWNVKSYFYAWFRDFYPWHVNKCVQVALSLSLLQSTSCCSFLVSQHLPPQRHSSHAFYCLLSYSLDYRNHFSFRLLYNSFLWLEKYEFDFHRTYMNHFVVWWLLVWTGFGELQVFQSYFMTLDRSFNQNPMIILFGALIIYGQLLVPAQGWFSDWEYLFTYYVTVVKIKSQ